MKTSNRTPMLMIGIIIVLAVTLFGGGKVLADDFSGGKGTIFDPYQIKTPQQLNNVRNYMSANFILMNNIDLSAWGNWEPIGNNDKLFCGFFDGNGHTITGLNINCSDYKYVGLFGAVDSKSLFKDLGLVDVNVYGDGKLLNSYCSGISSLAGRNEGTITRCYATGKVIGSCASMGGLVGENVGTITNCYTRCELASSNVHSEACIGGVVGRNYKIITNCYAQGIVSGIYTGGLVGFNFEGSEMKGTITNCYYDTQTTGQSDTDGTGKTTAEMMRQGTFNAWDFSDIWRINENNYPYLYWEPTYTITIQTQTNGTISGGGTFPKGRPVTVTATPNSGYIFDGWYAGTRNLSAEPNYTFISTADLTLTPVFVKYMAGHGTPDDPYQVTTAEQLNSVRYITSKYFYLMNDIDLTNYLSSTGSGYNAGAGWDPIGTVERPFSGTFAGKGHTIAGLFIKCPEGQDYAGLFGFTAEGGVVKSLSLVNTEVKGKKSAGALVGNNRGTIENCCVQGNVTGHDYVGGLVGVNQVGSIKKCCVTGNVSGCYAGGLVGHNLAGTIENCYAIGAVGDAMDGTGYIGELVGYNSGSGLVAYKSGIISNCYAAGQVSGNHSGGLVGYNNNGTITNSCYNRETSGQSDTNKGTPLYMADMKKDAFAYNLNTMNSTNTNSGIWSRTPDNSKNNGYPIFADASNLPTFKVTLNLNYNNLISDVYTTNNGFPPAPTRVGYIIAGWYTDQACTSKFNPGTSTSEGTILYLKWVPTGSISGSVSDGTNLIAGAIISLKIDGQVYSATSDAGGSYTITGVPDGTGYTVLVNKDRYRSGKAENISVVGGSAISGVNIIITLSSPVAKPVATPAAGTVAVGSAVVLTAGGGSTIYYTLNGDEPTINSSVFNSDTIITINKPTTIKAIAVLNEVCSEVMAATYQLFPLAGDGSSGNPYQITTPEQLNSVRNYMSAHFKLMNDVDLSAYSNWEPIGTESNPFQGTFLGNGKTVRSFTIIDKTRNYVGLFGYLGSGGMISELRLQGANTGSLNILDASIGGLVGCNQGTIKNCCYDTGNILGYGNVGGLVGYNEGTITNCYYTGKISGWLENIGGLAGYNKGTITNCYATGRVYGAGQFIAGLVGYNVGTITNCYATGEVNGDDSNCGGLAGYNEGTITNCYATGEVNGERSYCFGLAAYNKGTIANCYYDKDTTSRGYNGIGVPLSTLQMKNDTFAFNLNTTNNTNTNSRIWSRTPDNSQNTGYPIFADANNVPIFKCTLNFNYNNLSTTSAYTTNDGKISLPQAPTRAEYIFGGWYKDQACTTEFNPDIILSQDTMLYSKWKLHPSKPVATPASGKVVAGTIAVLTAGEGATIYYTLNGDEPTINSTVYRADTIITMNEPTTIKAIAVINGVSSELMTATYQPHPFAGGDGSSDNPYQITTAEQLNSIRNYISDNEGHPYFKLLNDIKLNFNSNDGWEPIEGFPGTFDGNGHRITDLFVDRPGFSSGLFGHAFGGCEIKNLGLENVNITGVAAGGLAGDNDGTITNCYVTGSVSSYFYAGGGLVGQNSGTITNCYATASVSSNNSSYCLSGGLVGTNIRGTIVNCYATGSLTSDGSCSGLIGKNDNGTVTNCYYDRQTTGQSDTGKGTGKTTAEMMRPGTFNGWNFPAIWRTNENNTYPYLYWQPTHTITIKTPQDGTVSGTGTYPDGYQVTLKATPNSGYTFDGWYAGERKLSSDSNYIFYLTFDLSLNPVFNKLNKTSDINECFTGY